MKREEHIQDSLGRIRNEDSRFYLENEKTIREMVSCLHEWFDAKYQGEKETSEIELLKHREERHHSEGIEECVKLLVREYGHWSEKIIRQEAIMHVKCDMGYVPEKNVYAEKNFWTKWIAKRDMKYI